ncbi:hypothetical protein [Labedella gwakjiensis]|uniref:hypothetical protein n=1 Tax=Labedella gwakjiensis TaxID=390269 RepID=UPI001304B925|nr:hypothetical protein [Labedella gwakjiensis]
MSASTRGTSIAGVGGAAVGVCPVGVLVGLATPVGAASTVAEHPDSRMAATSANAPAAAVRRG